MLVFLTHSQTNPPAASFGVNFRSYPVYEQFWAPPCWHCLLYLSWIAVRVSDLVSLCLPWSLQSLLNLSARVILPIISQILFLISPDLPMCSIWTLIKMMMWKSRHREVEVQKSRERGPPEIICSGIFNSPNFKVCL